MTIASVAAELSNLLTRTLRQLSGNGAFSLGGSKATGQNVPAGTNSANTSPIKALFSTIDSDANGTISKSELSSFLDTLKAGRDLLQVQEQNRQPSASEVLASADSDGDGALSFDEFKASLAASAPAGGSGGEASERFSRLDTNKDGVVSAAELAAALGSGTTTTSSSAAASSSSTALGLLVQAISAYSSTSSSTSAASGAGAANSLLKAA